jgi:hypothetical protein
MWVGRTGRGGKNGAWREWAGLQRGIVAVTQDRLFFFLDIQAGNLKNCDLSHGHRL